MWVEEIVAYLYLYGDGLFSEQLREWQWQVNELQLQTSLRWHSYITYNLTALRSFPLHSATLQLLPHTQFSFPRLGLLINVCPPIVSLVQCSFSVTLCLIVQTKPQRRPANAINLSSKFLERHSLATEDPSCLVWFPPQRLGFPSSHSSVCVWPHGFVCVAVGGGGFLCVFCQITAHCLVCLGMYTYAQSSAIKAFVSITENVPLAGIVSSSPSSPLLFLTAAAWFLQWRQRFHFSLYFSLFSTTLSLPSLPVLISDWHVRYWESSREDGAPQYFSILKSICLISCAMLSLLSQMEGYTLEMPGGISLVRLFRRNLQMLKSVSGMWELKGSSWRNKQLKMSDGRWRDYNMREIFDTNVQVLHFFKLHLSDSYS